MAARVYQDLGVQAKTAISCCGSDISVVGLLAACVDVYWEVHEPWGRDRHSSIYLFVVRQVQVREGEPSPIGRRDGFEEGD